MSQISDFRCAIIVAKIIHDIITISTERLKGEKMLYLTFVLSSLANSTQTTSGGRWGEGLET